MQVKEWSDSDLPLGVSLPIMPAALIFWSFSNNQVSWDYVTHGIDMLFRFQRIEESRNACHFYETNPTLPTLRDQLRGATTSLTALFHVLTQLPLPSRVSRKRLVPEPVVEVKPTPETQAEAEASTGSQVIVKIEKST